MAYYWFKSFHIFGVVAWFAGLFYLARLFIYHVEAELEPEPAQGILKQQYSIMEKRLYNIITTPAMVLTVAMAVGLLVQMPEFLKAGWMHAKLAFVGLLLIYHFYCGRLIKQLETGECKWNSKALRVFNEGPTLLLLLIVMLVIFKGEFPTGASTWLIAGLVLLFLVTIQLYARKRRLDKERAVAEAMPSVEEQALQS
ncbi:MAG: protoporphyrinogen oxidase HemJ [Leptolyngbya sp. SIO4C1]|nr:protoporphyrinogen oxidase HemJ [Leptolyngbya sp. SIO4C1]